MGFTFDRLGVRVPAIAVSAYTRAGTIIHDEMHHGAVIATLSRLHGLRPLTRRDEGANDLFSVVNLDDAARSAASGPTVQPMYVPANPHEDEPHRPQARRAQGQAAEPARERGCSACSSPSTATANAEEPQTYADAYRILQAHGLGLFYPKIA